MAGLTLTYTIEGQKQLSRTLLILADRVKDWSPAFRETASTLEQIFSDDVFETEGGAIEERWAALSPAYEAHKAKKYPGKGLLQATGAMRAGFTSLWRPDMAAVWNKVAYFKYHQSNAPRTKMPRRVMIKLAEAQKQIVVKIFHTYFQATVEASSHQYL
jgi:phage gpG-like protein